MGNAPHLLGVVRFQTATSEYSAIDFNEAPLWVAIYLNGTATGASTNKPADNNFESVLVTLGSNYKYQIFFNRMNVYYRYKINAGWQDWKPFTFSSE